MLLREESFRHGASPTVAAAARGESVSPAAGSRRDGLPRAATATSPFRVQIFRDGILCNPVPLRIGPLDDLCIVIISPVASLFGANANLGKKHDHTQCTANDQRTLHGFFIYLPSRPSGRAPDSNDFSEQMNKKSSAPRFKDFSPLSDPLNGDLNLPTSKANSQQPHPFTSKQNTKS